MQEESLVKPAAEEAVAAVKEQRIELRVSTEEKRIIAAKAKQAGLTTADYLRRAALGKRIAERVPPELRRLLGATGSNLNQLTKLANSGRLPGVGIEQLNELVTLLLQTLK
ncbi:MAG: plasmid mobilization protein [Janthinobacterium lividum]